MIIKFWRNLDWPQRLFLLLLSLHLLVNLIWISLDRQIPSWDQAGHTRLSMEFVDKWAQPAKVKKSFWQISSYYPPLIHWQVAIGMRFFGREVQVGAILITLYLLLTATAIYKLSNKLWGNRWIGLLSAAFLLFSPVIYTNSRWFLLDIPLLAFVVWSWYFLWQSQFLSKKRETIFLALSVAGVFLTKWTGLVFLFIPAIFVLYKIYKNKLWSKVWRQVLLLIAIVLVLIVPWYLANWQSILEQARISTTGEIDDPQVLWSIENWRFYLWEFLGFQVGLIPGVILLVLNGSYFYQKKNKYKKLLATYLIFIYIFFSLLSNKDIRYDLPLLVPLMMAAAVEIVNGAKWKKFLGGLALSWLIIFYFILSFHLLPTYQRAFNFGPLGWIDIINTGDTVVAYPQPDASANHLLLEDLVKLAGGKKSQVLLQVDQPHLSASTLHYLTVKKKIPNFTFISVPGDLDFNNEAVLQSYLDNFAYFIVSPQVTGVTASRALANLGLAQSYLLQSARFEKVFEYQSGDGPLLLMRRVK